MSWWGEKAAEKLETEPGPIAVAVNHVEETQSRVRELKNSLDALDAEMLAFKNKNRITTDRFSRLLGVNCSEMGGRAAVEREWRCLLRRRDSLASQWHAALHEWASMKGAAK